MLPNLPGEKGEVRWPAWSPAMFQWVIASYFLVRVPGPVHIFCSLHTCSGSFRTRQLLACLSQTTDAHDIGRKWSDGHMELHQRMRKGPGARQKERKPRVEGRVDQSSL